MSGLKIAGYENTLIDMESCVLIDMADIDVGLTEIYIEWNSPRWFR